MKNTEVIAVIQPRQRATIRVVSPLPGETYAQAVARQDARSARIAARVAALRVSPKANTP